MEQIGQFELMDEMGRGPITAVYRARHVETHQTVLLKLLPTAVSKHPAIIKRLQQWAIQMKTPPHPGLVPLLGLEEADGRFFTIMPEIPGGSLRDKIGSLPLEEINHILLRLTDILKALHKYDNLHLNLKPENVLFDEQGKIFVTDAGLAFIVRPLIDSYSGTPGYMSPAQIEGTAVSPSCDFYSLGLLLYEMLSGTPAYHADSDARLVVKQMTQTLPALHDTNPDISPLYDRLLERLCQLDDAQRPTSSDEAGQMILSVVAQVEEWPDSSNADYAADLPIFEHLSLYNRRELSKEEQDERTAAIQSLKAEEETASQRRMEHLNAIEEERQAWVREQLNQQKAQERTLLIIAFSVLLIFILGLVGAYLTSLAQ